MSIFRVILEKTAAILVILVSFLMAFFFWDRINRYNGTYGDNQWITTLIEQITVLITFGSLFCVMFFGGIWLLMNKSKGWVLTLCSLFFLGLFYSVTFVVQLEADDWFRFEDNWTLLFIPIVAFTFMFLMLHKEFWEKYPSSQKKHLVLGGLISAVITVVAQFF